MRSLHALSLLPLLPVLAITAACGDDTGRETETTVTTTDSGLTPATVTDTTPTSPTTSATTTPTEGSASSTVASGVSDSENTSGVTTGTSDPTATTTGASATTDNSTGPVSGSTSVGESTMACACTPGEVGGCEGDQQLVCSDDCTGFEATPCAMGQVCKGDACVALFCQPGEKVCEGEAAVKTCNAQGEAFDPPVNCADSEGCSVGQCTSLCLIAEATPSSVGCSFFAQRMDNFSNNANDSMIVGNVSKSKAATVQFYITPVGGNVEQPQGGPVVIMPGKTATFQLATAPFNKVSGLRKGGSYRIQSTIPVVAYQHSPIGAQATNDASMLLPEHALKTQHIVASYKDGLGAYPSYFSVIASADNTTVTWTPPQATLAGTGVPAVAANQTGQVLMNRFDTMEVRVGNGGDISGARVSADKPIWVVGAVNCVNVPNGVTYCDHIEEQMLPLDYWGKKYVGAHSPKRGSEKHYYRIFAGEDNTTITTTPVQNGTPAVLNKGQWKELEIPNNTSFIFEGDKPFLPVQYLAGQDGGAGTGDPASYQMIPVEQFLSSYAFATGTGYTTHYAQIIRLKGGADVKVDGVVVNGYYAVGEYEVADWKISEGGHLAESDANFGITVVGYTGVTSYAYPGGLQLAVINPQ